MSQFVKIATLFILFECIPFTTIAQDSCYNCNKDSIITELSLARSGTEKIKLLILNIDFDPTSDSTNYFIEQLIDLNNSYHLIDDAPYKKLKDANDFHRNMQYTQALENYHNAVELFDKKKKIIVSLLLGFRDVYNLLNKQEERYKYYKEKLDYYLVNGPFENTAACYHGVAGYFSFTGDYNQAISHYLKAADVFNKFYLFWYYNELGIIGVYYVEWGNLNKALEYLNISLPILRTMPQSSIAYFEVALGYIKLAQKKYDEALLHADSVINEYKSNSTNRFYAIGLVLKAMAYVKASQPAAAYPLLLEAKKLSDSIYHGRMTAATTSTLEIDFGLYQYFAAIKNFRAAEKSLLLAYNRSVDEKENILRLKYLKELSVFYVQQNQMELSKRFINEYYALEEKMEKEQSDFKVAQYENEKKQIEQLQNISTLREERTIQESAIKKRTTILWISLIALVLICTSMFFLYKQLRINKKDLFSLRSSQKQLIQSEKMASLGELTAGIAHEIQNPLNFVNNFSEVNTELIDELGKEAEKGNLDEVKAIAKDIKENEQKINHHGKRADAIVKGMLQHSRTSSGQKELTDINALADEYLRLAYHGLRAKDKTFNAKLETDFDSSIGKINVIPQDIGRVLVNLINNAFYAVAQKKQTTNSDYEPKVAVRTKKSGDIVEIRVQDNGMGIPQKILDKIFQPFFTTKPTGQGTGLGLSLAYDIVKAHGGNIQVNTRENEGTEFIISLPAANAPTRS